MPKSVFTDSVSRMFETMLHMLLYCQHVRVGLSAHNQLHPQHHESLLVMAQMSRLDDIPKLGI